MTLWIPPRSFRAWHTTSGPHPRAALRHRAAAPGRRRDDPARFLAGLLTTFNDDILPIQRTQAERAAELRVRLAAQGRIFEPTDALIAATALVRGLTLVTRDVGDFEVCGIDLCNPWDDA